MSTNESGEDQYTPALKVRTLRKGAHSCYECSRRKTKCVFLPEKPEQCVSCYSRGNTCFGQEYAAAPPKPAMRRNFSDRLSRLEKSFAASRTPPTSALESSHTEGSSKSLGSDSIDEYDGDGRSNVWKFDMLDMMASAESRDNKIRQLLLSVLPTGAELAMALKEKNMIWSIITSRYMPPEIRWENLEAFAAHAFSHGTALDIAQIVQAFMMSCDDQFYHKASFIFDHLVFCDKKYTSTIQGLHAEIMHGCIYAERGNNMKCWSTWRRCLEHAQFLGIHKSRSTHESELIWNAVYNFDRFQSMLVGRPHGILNSHCKPPELSFQPGLEGWNLLDFVFHELGKISGKISDHVQQFYGTNAPPQHELTNLEQELAHLLLKLPPDFWQVDMELSSLGPAQLKARRCRIISQLAYYQTCLGLYLPYMFQSFQFAHYEFTRITCIQTCRNFVVTYNHFRDISTLMPIKPRTFDGVSCIAGLVLLFSTRSAALVRSTWQQRKADIALIESLMTVLEQSANKEGATSARQCLQLLRGVKDMVSIDTDQLLDQGPFELLTNLDGAKYFLAGLKELGKSNQVPIEHSITGEPESWSQPSSANVAYLSNTPNPATGTSQQPMFTVLPHIEGPGTRGFLADWESQQ